MDTYKIPVYTNVAYTTILILYFPFFIGSELAVKSQLILYHIAGRMIQTSLPLQSTGFASTNSTNCGLETVFSIHGWKFADAEGRLYALLYVILH